MACLEMYNNSQPSPPSMSPRISFSNDFVESQNNNTNNFISKRTELPLPTSDFEFSVSNISRLTSSADELFFKGRLLPFKNNNNNNNNGSQSQRTLRDELLVNDDDNDGGEGNIDFSLKPPKGSSSFSTNKWKGFLGLRKSHIGSKKAEKVDVFSFDSGKRFSFSIEDPNLAKSSQEMVSNSEGPSSSDIEMGI